MKRPATVGTGKNARPAVEGWPRGCC